MKQKQDQTMMTEGVIWKQLLFFSIPLILSNFLQQFYSLLDSLFVGKYVGDLELAAVGSTGSLVNLLVGFFLGLSAGAGIVISNFYGARNKEMLVKALNASILISLGGGLLLTLLGWFLTPLLLRIMNVPDGVFGFALQYLRIYFLGMVPMMLYNMGAGILRALGDSRRPMIILFYCMILHLVLNYVFILLWRMGVSGAAISTGISQLASAVWVTILFLKADGVERIDPRNIHMDWPIFKKIVRISVPAGFQSSLYSIANIMIQANVNVFGPIAMAGTAAYYRVDNFLYGPMAAIGVAVTTFVGQNIGANEFGRIKRGIRSALLMTVPTSIFLAVLVVVFRYQMLSWFTSSPEVQQTGITVLLLMAPFFWIHSMTEVLIGAIRGSGNAFTPMIITLVTICAFRIVWILVVTSFWKDLRAVIMSFPTSWILCFITFAVYYYRKSRSHPLPQITK